MQAVATDGVAWSLSVCLSLCVLVRGLCAAAAVAAAAVMQALVSNSAAVVSVGKVKR